MGKSLIMKLELNEKKIAVFCPSFFGYDIDIKNALEGLGAEVHLSDERVFESVFGRALVRLGFNSLVRPHVNAFYTSNLINRVKNLDYVLLINPETIPVELIKKSKEINSDVIIITYMWDSFKNKPFSKRYIDVSDVFYSFDPIDVKENNLKFLPLFYTNDYENIKSSDIKYDFSFVGTAHSERFKSVLNISKGDYKRLLFFYCPSKLVFAYKKYLKNELAGLELKDVSFSPMSRQKVINLIEDSRVIIDISHPSQVGLTMRTIEMLGAQKKLITTNEQVLNYDFYHANNILVVDEKISQEIIRSFVETPYTPVNLRTRDQYSINSWIEKLFL